MAITDEDIKTVITYFLSSDLVQKSCREYGLPYVANPGFISNKVRVELNESYVIGERDKRALVDKLITTLVSSEVIAFVLDKLDKETTT